MMQAKIEQALKGEYSLKYTSLLKDAWQAVEGMKAPFWLGLFLQLLSLGAILLIYSFISLGLRKIQIHAVQDFIFLATQIMLAIVGFIFLMGLFNLCATKLLGQAVKARMVLAFLNWQGIKNLFFLAIIYCLVLLFLTHMLYTLSISLLILSHPGHTIGFLTVFAVFAFIAFVLFLALWFVLGVCLNAGLLVVTLRMTVLSALSIACRALWKQRVKVVGVYLLGVILLMIALIPLGLGLKLFLHMAHGHLIYDSFYITHITVGVLAILSFCVIWVCPLLVNLNAALFKTVFGIES